MTLIHEEITDGIIHAFYTVYNELGYGFAEKVYENSLVIELQALGFEVQAQYPIAVHYKGRVVGDYVADLVVNRCVIVELKAAECLSKAHAAQLQNYLRATEIEVGLLLNFGKKAEFERKVFQSARTNPR